MSASAAGWSWHLPEFMLELDGAGTAWMEQELLGMQLALELVQSRAAEAEAGA